jgi:hypothetical protein
MNNAEQIAAIAQSELVWDIFVQSELFANAAPNRDVINEARSIVQNKLTRLSEGHPERQRAEEALERLKLCSQSVVRKEEFLA